MNKKILVIDDNDLDRTIIKRYLTKEGYDRLLFAENGEDGVKITLAEKPDLVISDTMLPGIDGFEVTRQIREAEGKERPKIIVITGGVDAVDAVKARRMGADDYCAKTSDCVPILEAVRQVFN